MLPAGRSLVTTEFAPTTQRSPIVTPLVTTTFAPNQQLSPIRVGPFDEFADQRQGSLGVGPTTPSQMPPETPPAPGQPGSAATTPPPDQPPGG